MKKIFLIAFIFCSLFSEAQFTTSGSIRNSASSTAGTSFTTTYASSLAAGKLAVFTYGSDNLGSGSDGDKADVTSVTDDAGNTYTKDGEFSNVQSGAATGATVGMWHCVLTNPVTTSTIVTIQFGSSVTAKTWSLQGFSFGAGSTISVFSPFTTAANDGTTVQSASTGTLTSREYLIFRLTAAETSSLFTTATTAGWTSGSGASAGWNSTTGGSATSNMGMFSEYKIATTPSETSAPPAGASADQATIVMAFYEVVAAVNHKGAFFKILNQ